MAGPLKHPHMDRGNEIQSSGVGIWALPAVRVSEASDLTLKFHSDFALLQILIGKKCSQILLPKLLSKINTPRRQTIFILYH